MRPKDGIRSDLVQRRKGPVPRPGIPGGVASPIPQNGNGHTQAAPRQDLISTRVMLQLLQEVRLLRSELAELRSVMAGETDPAPETREMAQENSPSPVTPTEDATPSEEQPSGRRTRRT